MAPQRSKEMKEWQALHWLLSEGASFLPWSLGRFVSEPRRKCIRVGQMYFFHEDAISRVGWICTFVSSQAGSNLISPDHTANSPLDKHPHAIPGACLFCLAAFRLSYCQSMGHAEMKETKLHTGFYVLLLRSCSLPEMLGFSAKYLSYSLRTVCSSPRRMSQRKPCKRFPVFNKAGATI